MMLTRRQFLESLMIGGTALAAPALMVGADNPVTALPKAFICLSNTLVTDYTVLWVNCPGDYNMMPPWAIKGVAFRPDEYGRLRFTARFLIEEDSCYIRCIAVQIPEWEVLRKLPMEHGPIALHKDYILDIRGHLAPLPQAPWYRDKRNALEHRV